MNKEQTLERVKKEAADAKLFVFDTSTPSIYSDVEFAGTIKKMYPNAFTMLVGTHPSATPDETMGISELIDGLARHEYDYIVRDTAIALRDGTDLAGVRGLTYRKDGEVVHNPDAEHITDLDEIPYAAEFIKRRLCVTDYVFPAAAFPSIQILLAVAVLHSVTSVFIRRLFMAIAIDCAVRKTLLEKSNTLSITSRM